MASRPLVVAGVAAALLVVTLGVDASMTTTYAFDVWTGAAWRELAREPHTFDGRGVPPYAQTTISANQSDDVRFRLRVDNGNFWAGTHRFTVLHMGEIVAEGTVEAPSRTQRVAELKVPATRFFDGTSVTGKTPEPRPVDPGAGPLYVDLYIEVDGSSLNANFNIQEVSA